MFRDVKFHNTLTHAQWSERAVLVSEITRLSIRTAQGYKVSKEQCARKGAISAQLDGINAALGITPVMIIVILKNVNGECIYDVVEAPPFLHKECLLAALIEFIVSTVDARHNAPSAFNGEKPWAFWDIKMPKNKGIMRGEFSERKEEK